MFAVAENGAISLFREHLLIAFKNIIRNYQPVKEFFLKSPYMQRTLPPEYVSLVKRQCRHDSERICVKYDDGATSETVVSLIDVQLHNQGQLQDRTDGMLFSLATLIHQQFNRMGITPNSEMVRTLREHGAIPRVRHHLSTSALADEPMQGLGDFDDLAAIDNTHVVFRRVRNFLSRDMVDEPLR